MTPHTFYSDKFDDPRYVGNGWISYRKSLSPRYVAAWRAIFFSWVGLFLIVSSTAYLSGFTQNPLLQALICLAGASGVGLVFAYLILWFHEAAHFNLHSNARKNDLIANLSMGIFVGQNIKRYRRSHFRHHQYLGDFKDPECSYFHHPGIKLFLRSLLGIQIFEVLAARKNTASSLEVAEGTEAVQPKGASFVAAGVFTHTGIIALLALSAGITTAGAWMIGIGCVYPAVNAMRQSLEHRHPNTGPTHFGPAVEGQYTRTFRRSIFNEFIGGAGFRRHIIHHWDPALSCTLFDEAEQFLQQRCGIILDDSDGYVTALYKHWKKY